MITTGETIPSAVTASIAARRDAGAVVDIAKMSKATGLAEFEDAIARSCAAGRVAVEAVLGRSKRPHLR